MGKLFRQPGPPAEHGSLCAQNLGFQLRDQQDDITTVTYVFTVTAQMA